MPEIKVVTTIVSTVYAGQDGEVEADHNIEIQGSHEDIPGDLFKAIARDAANAVIKSIDEDSAMH